MTTSLSRISYITATAISDTKFYLASSIDSMVEEYGDDTSFTRLFIFKYLTTDQGEWFYHDIDFYTISTCFVNSPSEKVLYTLGEDGEIEVFNGVEGAKRHIPNSGLREAWSKDRGYMAKIRNLNGKLFATGYGAQIFRLENEVWLDWSDGLVGLSIDDDISVTDICNRDDSSFICVGRYENRGLLAFKNDKSSWSVLHKATPAILYGAVTLKSSSVFACGAYGNLLEVDINNNIKRHTNLNITVNFYNLTAFNDVIYLASDAGLYQFKSGQISQVNINEEVNESLIIAIDSTDNILWACTQKQILRFDGKFWEIIDHPDNAEEDFKRIKCHAGEACPQSGEWYSPANEMKKRYFKEGEIMEEIPNNSWGETIWYLDL